jgi:hypothetical protein
MSIVFVDSAYHVIDSLIPHAKQLVIPSASVNTVTGMVIQPTTPTSTDFPIPSSVISQLNNVKYILMSATVNSANPNGTSPPPNVKFYNFYTVDISLGVDVKMFLKF